MRSDKIYCISLLLCKNLKRLLKRKKGGNTFFVWYFVVLQAYLITLKLFMMFLLI